MNILYILFFWLIFLPVSLYSISERISVIGIYHPKDDESFKIKVRKMLSANYNLSFPIIISVFIYIQSTVPEYNPMDLLNISIGVTLIALISIRLLSNPCSFLKPNLCKKCVYGEHIKIIEIHKERIISFFYSFICAVVILIMGYWTNYIIKDENLNGKLTNLLSLLTFEKAMIIVGLYTISLVIITVIGEIILFFNEPLVQVEYPK